MIKNTFKALLVMFTVLTLSACGDSNAPQSGKHYTQLPNDLSHLDLAPVTEVFALTCGHCRGMEKLIPELEKLIEQDIEKVHVTFNQSAQVSAMFYYAAEMQLGKAPDEEMLEELFSAVQMNDATMTEQQSLITKAFTKRGLKSPYALDKLDMKKLNRYFDLADEVTNKGQINSVPTFIVAGKYEIRTEGHESLEELAKTINYLLADK